MRAPLTLAELPEPIIIGHRGSGFIHPEESLYAYEQESLLWGEDMRFMHEADVVELLGSEEMLVFHDSTLDRTTDGSGPTNQVRHGMVKSFRVDQYDANGANFPDEKLRLLTVREMIEKFGRKRCLNFECKTVAARQNLINLIKQYQYEDYAFVYVTTPTERDLFIQNGIRCMVTGNAIEFGTKTAKQLADLGVTDIGWGWFTPEQTEMWDIVQEYYEEGISGWMGGMSRHWWAFQRTQPGMIGGYSDEPIWASGKSLRYDSDRFHLRKFLPGHIPYQIGYPGVFKSLPGGVTGWGPWGGSNGWVMWGWLCPHPKARDGAFDIESGVIQQKQPRYPFGIEFDATLVAGDGVARAAGVAFTDKDYPFHDSLGAGVSHGQTALMALVRSNEISLSTSNDGARTQLWAGLPHSLAAGEKIRVRLEFVSSDRFRITNVSSGQSAEMDVPPGLGQGGYIYAGTPGSGNGDWAFSSVHLTY